VDALSWIGLVAAQESFNMALSLCRVLEVALHFSKDFSEAATEAPQPLKETIVCFLEQEFSL